MCKEWKRTIPSIQFKMGSSQSESQHISEEENFQPLLDPFEYIASLPGKEIREKLADAFNFWLNVPTTKLNAIKEIIRILHNASIIVDDIQDGSKHRRKERVAHAQYGIPLTLASVHYATALALQKIKQLREYRAMGIFSEEIIEMSRGQGMEIWWREKGACPTEEQYEQIILKKTEGLFSLMVRLLQLFSLSTLDFKRLIHLLSLYFQIRDDYENIKSVQYASQKGWFEDLTEGKFSFPIIHALAVTKCSSQDSDVLRNILKLRTRDPVKKQVVVDILSKCNSFKYTQTKLLKLKGLITVEIKRLGNNPKLKTVFNQTFLKTPPVVNREARGNNRIFKTTSSKRRRKVSSRKNWILNKFKEWKMWFRFKFDSIKRGVHKFAKQ